VNGNNKENRSAHTISSLLEDLKTKIPSFKEGQIFEIKKSIYPTEEVPKDKKNIEINENVFTKPLALSRKDKHNAVKEKSSLVDFFKNVSRGDFLKVVSVEGPEAKCVNLSLKEEIMKRFYSDDFTKHITLRLEDIANGTAKPFSRKLNKYLK
jgi:hypothetical protein